MFTEKENTAPAARKGRPPSTVQKNKGQKILLVAPHGGLKPSDQAFSSTPKALESPAIHQPAVSPHLSPVTSFSSHSLRSYCSTPPFSTSLCPTSSTPTRWSDGSARNLSKQLHNSSLQGEYLVEQYTCIYMCVYLSC